MSIRDEIFNNNLTLFEVLDNQDITNINREITLLQQQLATLGNTVASNYATVNDRITLLDTRLTTLSEQVSDNTLALDHVSSELEILAEWVQEIDPVEILRRVDAMDERIADIDTEVQFQSSRTTLNTTSIANLNSSLTATNAVVGNLLQSYNVLENRVTTIEANAGRNTILRIGNEYMWSWRQATQNFYRRITFTGTAGTLVTANVWRACSILDSETGTQYNTSVKLCATFDTFRTVGTQNYNMLLGPCYMQRTGDVTEGPVGYITPI